MTLVNEPLRWEGVQYATGEKQRAITNSSRKNEEAGPKRKRRSAVDMSSAEGIVRCIGTWNVRSIYCCSVTKSCLTLCDPMDCKLPDFPVLHCLPEFAQTHVHWIGDAIQPSHSLSSPSPPALKISQHQIFSNELALCIRWPKYRLFSFSSSISPSNEYSRLISFKIDYFDILRSINQGELDGVKQEMARLNINILGISELKWMLMLLSHFSHVRLCVTP